MPRKQPKTDNPFEGMDFSEFTNPEPKKVEKPIETTEYKPPRGGERCFLITFKNIPDIACVVFAKNKFKGLWKGCKFFKEQMHPLFMGSSSDDQLKQSKAKRVPELDKYVHDKKIPIPELMKHLNFTFPCSACGQDNFTYKDYEIKRCFIVENEGDLNDFTKGYVLCYNCFKKYTNN